MTNPNIVELKLTPQEQNAVISALCLFTATDESELVAPAGWALSRLVGLRNERLESIRPTEGCTCGEAYGTRKRYARKCDHCVNGEG